MPNTTKELKKRLNTQANSFYDEDGLKKQGFPPEMSKAFLETADKLDCVILSRTPGGAATRLITEGYDLKGYEIKSKSCNWGPMAGFLCKLPPLNKMGVEKIKYNYGYLKSYVDKWKKKDKLGTSTKYQIKDLFQPIKISDDRQKELFDPKSSYGIGKEGEDYIVLEKTGVPEEPTMIYGICSTVNLKNENKVTMDYLLIKDGKTWEAYHGQIFYGSEYKEYTGKEKRDFFVDEKDKEKPIDRDITQHSKTDPFPIEDKKHIIKIKQLRDKKAGDYGFKELKFFPIQGAVNPYPPYPDSYKNCVTGDYDLFACWPKSTYPLQELIRQAEFSLGKENYFSRFGKNLTLGLRPAGAFNHIYIEFIPGVPAINNLEDPRKGNINDLTELVAGTLNSIAGVAIKNDKTYANKAFHSDEGGRPMIDDIEFPIAYFLPDSLFEKLKSQDKVNELPDYAMEFKKRGPDHQIRGGLIDTVGKLLDLIITCAENGYRVTLSHGWFIFLITKALNKGQREKIQSEINAEGKLFKKIYTDEERGERISKLKDKVKKYFINVCYDAQIVPKVLKYLLGKSFQQPGRLKEIKSATPKFLDKVAKVFLPFLDMNEDGKSEIIKKVEAAKNIAYDHKDFEVN